MQPIQTSLPSVPRTRVTLHWSESFRRILNRKFVSFAGAFVIISASTILFPSLSTNSITTSTLSRGLANSQLFSTFILIRTCLSSSSSVHEEKARTHSMKSTFFKTNNLVMQKRGHRRIDKEQDKHNI